MNKCTEMCTRMISVAVTFNDLSNMHCPFLPWLSKPDFAQKQRDQLQSLFPTSVAARHSRVTAFDPCRLTRNLSSGNIWSSNERCVSIWHLRFPQLLLPGLNVSMMPDTGSHPGIVSERSGQAQTPPSFRFQRHGHVTYWGRLMQTPSHSTLPLCLVPSWIYFIQQWFHSFFSTLVIIFLSPIKMQVAP